MRGDFILVPVTKKQNLRHIMSPASVTKTASIGANVWTSVSSQPSEKISNLTQPPSPMVTLAPTWQAHSSKPFVILGFYRRFRGSELGRVSQLLPVSLVTPSHIPHPRATAKPSLPLSQQTSSHTPQSLRSHQNDRSAHKDRSFL